MTHDWDVGERVLDRVVSQCRVCGGFRTRPALYGVDYSNGPGLTLDGVGETTQGWQLDIDTPKECHLGAPKLPSRDELAGMLERGEIG